MRPPRFRLRSLLIAVAIVTVLVGAERMRRRASTYRALASHHREREQMHRESVAVASAEADELMRRGSRDGADLWAGRARYNVGQAADHAELALKYEHAARYPWLSIPPDPPPPE